MKKFLTILALSGIIVTSFPGSVYAKEVNLNTQTNNKTTVVAATGQTYTCSMYFDTVVYRQANKTFDLSAGQSIKISWTSGRPFNIYLRNNTTGNITSFKTSSSSVTYTNMRAGNYTFLASNLPNKKETGTSYTQKFTVKIY
ncbi:hypothetical protein CLPUN_42180 [Clostridium puniceum]|uniref:Peptidase C-terminal archaeal/bacterial domain-containing protein n=1 Tax=Clostridium puniceum TaxID=29367 RepID=A0A1S8T865_9CLOT|nr:pre-peptidase C-terminal domain-containing protein [Clostridium puniceum]OOM73980.1 hypothetical protein CLPUN_42180 [Clostridium puniceum]